MNTAFMIVEIPFNTEAESAPAVEKEFINTFPLLKLLGVAEIHNEQGEILYQADVRLVG